MGFYPIFLEIADRPCLVVGGGAVAQRKVEGLLAAGAQVTVVSPRLTAGLVVLRQQGRIQHIARGYVPGDLAGFILAIVASDDRAVNDAVAQEARQRGVWVNAVDDPANCDFIMPSVVRRGDLMIAISTGGGSPALARKVREDLEEFLGEGYDLLLDLVAEVRQELKGEGLQPPPAAWNAALDRELRALLAQGKRQQARERLLRALTAHAEADTR